MIEVRAEISGVYAGLGSFVVIYILWPAVTSISLSPSFTLKFYSFKVTIFSKGLLYSLFYQF